MAAKNGLESSRGCSPKKLSTSPPNGSSYFINNNNNRRTPPRQQQYQHQRSNGSSNCGSPPGSNRTSPGLVAGHYAGCKFTEPPLPSALPQPPQHWLQPTNTIPSNGKFIFNTISKHPRQIQPQLLLVNA
jgi:hypothetical protein